MGDWPASDSALRAAAAILGLAAAWGLERVFAFRGPGGAKREMRHLAVWAIGALLVQAIPLAAAVGAAEFARRSGIGLLNLLSLPSAVAIPLTIVGLDAWTYWLHRAYHASPLLWRLHRVHHSDERLTATTGVRFHPGEILVSALARIPVVLALGASPVGVVAFEVGLLLASQLQHADVRLPDRWARRLGRFLITPNLHRTHHSTRRAEADTNFGTISSVWDTGFGTLRVIEPDRITIGAPDGRSVPSDASLWKLLALPFPRRHGAS